MPTIVVDLDGTLAEWEVAGNGVAVGAWRDGAQKFLREALAIPHDRWPTRVVVQSCRATWDAGGGWQSIAAFLASGGFLPWLIESVPTAGDEGREVWYEVLAFPDGMAAEWRRSARMPQLGPDPDTPAVGIWRGLGKPIGAAYVDDRAVVVPADGPLTACLDEVRRLL